MTQTDERRTRRNRWRPAALAVLAALVVVIGVYWLMTQGPGRQLLSPARSSIAEFSGEGDQTTDSFQVREGWAIEWESTGESFAFAILGDRDFGTVIDLDEPGSGVTSPTGAGTFHLEITAGGPWSIRIKQGQ